MARRTTLAALVGTTLVGVVMAQAPAPLLTPESKLPTRHSIPVFGQKIVYYDIGAGPVIVLVHGFGSEARFDWGNVLMPLSQHHRVIAMDQIGFGTSDKPFIDYSIQTYVDFLGEFLRTQNVHEFTLVGESLGGWISAVYTIEALAPANTGPNALPRPSRLVLSDAAGMSAAHITSQSMPIPIAGTLADAHGVAIVFHDKSRVTDDFVREAWAMKMKANDGFTERSIWSNPRIATEVVKDRIGSISVPTLVVWGGDDELVSLEQGRAYAAGIPGAKLVIVPDCGHGPAIEKPREFLAAVIPFIDAH
jgi:pimeloyl-ACP methyl ester carboxylesterase